MSDLFHILICFTAQTILMVQLKSYDHSFPPFLLYLGFEHVIVASEK